MFEANWNIPQLLIVIILQVDRIASEVSGKFQCTRSLIGRLLKVDLEAFSTFVEDREKNFDAKKIEAYSSLGKFGFLQNLLAILHPCFCAKGPFK